MKSHRVQTRNHRGPAAGGKVQADPATEKEAATLVAREAAAFGFAVAPAVAEALAIYFELLLRWGARINLTAARSLAALASDHLPDALAIASRISTRRESDPAFGGRCLDAGSGGGLPAIPLALLQPAVSLVLVEATAKKAAFLRTAVRELGLEARIEVQHRRLERRSSGQESSGDQGELGGFDAALSRAMLAPEEWLPLGRSLVRARGVVFCLSSRPLEATTIGLELVHQVRYRAESDRTERWLAELERST